jgi:uncharacterized protein
MRKRMILSIIFYFITLSIILGQENVKTDTFKFVIEGKELVGIIDSPTDKQPISLIILVPGDGQTNLNFGLLKDLRSHFTQMGLICCVWDKAGCGKSEGKYDDQQTVQNSANEFITAIRKLKGLDIAGSKNIGLWGISRGGWIAPLIIEKERSIAFWISVSGVDGEDNNTYLLEKNLIIQGRPEDSVKLLISEYKAGNRLFWQSGSFEDYVRSTKNLYKDPLFRKLHGSQYSKEEYYKDQNEAMKKYKFDNETASITIVPYFAETLDKIECPVLAIFGEKDSQVDWQKTLTFYKQTIGKNPKSNLTIKTFPNCGHPLMKCKTCGIDFEDLKLFNYQPCDGYYEYMGKWLSEHNFIK